ncbi:MAG: restriction endonuclease subunit S [Myxococcota bacterium]
MTWREVPLASLAEGGVLFDGPHATPHKQDEGPVFLGILSLLDGRVDVSLSRRISEHQFARWTRRVQPRPDDLVFAYETSGPLTRRVALIPAGLRCCLGRRMGLLRPDRTRVDPRFLLYSYLSPAFQQTLMSRVVEGSTTQRLRLTQMPDFPIRITDDLSEQRRIAGVLGALDDKIALNRAMNRTLDAMIGALFRSWFIDFHGVPGSEMVDSERGPIPRGWHTEALDSVAHFLNGAPCQKYPAEDGRACVPVIKVRELKHGVSANSDRATSSIPSQWWVFDGDVLFSWSGSLVVTIWTGGEGALNQHLFKVTSERYPRWFYFLWTRHHLARFQRIAADKATTMGHIKRRHLTEALCVVPPPPIMQEHSDVMAPLVERQIVNDRQARTLTKLRDVLLPKLLGGEIRVPEAERLVEVAV